MTRLMAGNDRGHRRLRRGVLWLALGLAACGDDPSPTGPGGEPGPNPAPLPVAEVRVSPASAQLLTGDTIRLSATARSADSAVITGKTVTWRSLNAQVATISSTGLLTAVGTGTAIIRATVDGIAGEASLGVATLNPAPVLSALTPDATDTEAGSTVVQLRGNGFVRGSSILWNGEARPAMYVDQSELRLVLGPNDLRQSGARTIAVHNPAPGGGTSGTLPFTIGIGIASVTVSPTTLQLSVGQTATLTARALDAAGGEILGRTFEWTSSNPGAISVSASGVVTATNTGPAIITVKAGGKSAQVQVSAVARVQTLWVTPSPAATLVGSFVTLDARTFAAGQVEVFNRPITWSSETPSVATVDGQGRVTGVSKGSARIRAESEGVVTFVTVDVRQWGPGWTSVLQLRGMVETMVWPTVGAGTWTDASGTTHTVTKSLTGGALTMHFDTGRWERHLTIRWFALGLGEVAQETWTDQGTFTYIFGGGGFTLQSETTGATLTAYDQLQGEVLINERVGTAGPLTYRWIVE